MSRLNHVARKLENMKLSGEYFASLKLKCDTIIDVGVHTGTSWLYDAYPDAAFHLIDPLPDRDAVAQSYPDLATTWHECALGAEKGQQVLQVPVSDGHELRQLATFEERTSQNLRRVKSSEIKEVTTKVETLDTLFADLPGPIGLKVDVEGGEYDVLLGAPQTLRKCAFVMLEVSLVQRFAETRKFSEIVALMAMNDYEVGGIFSGFRPNARISDLLFLRNASRRNGAV